MKRYVAVLLSLVFMIAPLQSALASVHYDNNTSQTYYVDVWETQNGTIDFYDIDTHQYSHTEYVNSAQYVSYAVEPGGLTLTDQWHYYNGPFNGYYVEYAVYFTFN
jgi:hypothetical protein